MTCREVADFILDYLSEELPAPTRVAFEIHLSRCPNCIEYLRQYQVCIQLGRRAFADDAAPAIRAGVPEDLVAAILASTSELRTKN